MKHFLLISLFFIVFKSQAQTTADVTFQIKCISSISPASATLTWKKNTLSATYDVARKLRTDVNWTVIASNLAINDTTYTDNTLLPNIDYEYRVSNPAMTSTGYVNLSLNLPAKHYMGKMILVIDSAYINSLSTDIKTLQTDFILEGWTVATVFAGRTQSVTDVKQSIKNIYQTAPTEVKGIFILGHVPVPYSGSLNPDGHPDHSGAWPTDLYYCDTLSNFWTDISVNNVAASRPENINIPGDGKFDQTTINNILMFVGRADVYDMPAFSSNDTMLAQRYLAKNHTYRTATKTYRMRGMIDDNFGYFSGEAFAQNGYRNFSNLLGADSVIDGDYFTDMKNNSYLWSYGCGGGWYQGAGGVGNTNNFQTDTVQSVFTLLFGSYFGDWDNQNNFLRAPIASPSPTLTNFWAGRPQLFLHHMGMGEPIGNSFSASVNNSYTYVPTGYGSKMVHQSLMGDPTLKMYVYKGAWGLTANTINGGSIATLTWLDSPDPDVIGYFVYRTKSLTDSFTLLTNNYTQNTNYHDSTAPQGKNIYMVRAVKLQNTNSGKFYNLSPGVMDSVQISTPFATNDIEKNNTIQLFPNPATDYTNIQSFTENIESIKVYNAMGQLVLSKIVQQKNLTIHTQKWVKGTYHIELNIGGEIASRKLIVR